MMNTLKLTLVSALVLTHLSAANVERSQVFQKLYGVSDTTGIMTTKMAAMGAYEGLREKAGNVQATIDFQAYTFTRPNYFQMHTYFTPKNNKEGKNVPHADLFMMSVDMDLETYQLLFESDVEVNKKWTGSVVYQFEATAKTNQDGRREIVISQQTTVNDEDPVVTRKGKATIEVKNSSILSVSMQKWARRSILNPIGLVKRWDKVFDDKLIVSKRVKTGLALRDEGEVTRAINVEQIYQALSTQKPADYQAVAKQNRK
ncbi:MAG: hypothetical protein KC646_17350 [Candidatus Cloacimonetes bacterium]|nr:hypothetical protein [Candidatus Cloacimonadota bacterium]